MQPSHARCAVTALITQFLTTNAPFILHTFCIPLLSLFHLHAALAPLDLAVPDSCGPPAATGRHKRRTATVKGLPLDLLSLSISLKVMPGFPLCTKQVLSRLSSVLIAGRLGRE